MTRKGSNSVQVRKYNERVVLEALRRLGTASKADLARSTNLTPQAVAGIVDGLVELGLVEHRGRRTGLVGQPSVMFAPDPDGAFAIGLHVGRRALDAVLVDFTGAVRRLEILRVRLSRTTQRRAPGNVLRRHADSVAEA